MLLLGLLLVTSTLWAETSQPVIRLSPQHKEQDPPRVIRLAPPSKPKPPPPKTYRPFIEGNGRTGDVLRGGGLTLWVPALQDDCQLLFAQAHGGYYRKFLTKWSIGGGYRRLLRQDLGIGINAFYDIGHADSGHNFFQGGIGAQAFGPCWIIRANGYLPRRRVIAIDNQATLVGTSIFPNVLNQVTYAGLDVEGGYGIPLYCGEAWGYAGYFYYSTRGFPTIQGPRLRGEYVLYGSGTAGPQLSIAGEYRYDQVNRNQGAMIVRLRLPLSCQWKPRLGRCVPRIQRRMGDPVHRELNIWVQNIRQLGRTPLANLLFFAQVGAAASGTQSDPTTLADAIARSQVGDVLFALNSSGNITGDVVLKDHQQLVGFGDGSSQTLSVDGFIVTIPKTSAGGRGTLAGVAGSTLAQSNTVKGIGFSSGTGYLNGTAFGDLLIDDVLATGQTNGSPAIGLTGEGNLTLTNSSITSATLEDALEIVSLNGRALITNNTLSGGANTIELRNTVNGDVTVFGNQLNSVSTATRLFVNYTAGNGTLNLSATHNTSLALGLGTFAQISSNGASAPQITWDLSDNNVTGISLFAVLSEVLNPAETLNFAIRNNTFTGAPSTGAAITLSTTAGTNNYRIEGNTISNFTTGGAGEAIFLSNIAGGPGSITALINNNTAINCQRVVYLKQDTAGNSGAGNYTVTNNRGTMMLAAHPSYECATPPDARVTCYTIENNQSDSANASPLTIGAATGGSVSVFPSSVPATLSAANNGMTTTVGAAVTTAPTPCPLPPPIP